MTIRTRFAPRPTGYLHIGGVRTALFNYLLAKQAGGQFLLRIDDTDQNRNVQAALQPILDGFKWLGLNWDEGPEVGLGVVDVAGVVPFGQGSFDCAADQLLEFLEYDGDGLLRSGFTVADGLGIGRGQRRGKHPCRKDLGQIFGILA